MSEGIFKLVGDWKKEMNVPLSTALQASIDVIGRTGEEACRHAIILMSQSASAITETSPQKRKIMRDPAFGGTGKGNRLKGSRYIEVWNQGDKQATKLFEYRWKFGFRDKPKLTGTFEEARTIVHRGLAKRSWMWGLGRFGKHTARAGIRGLFKIHTILGETVSGYVKENRLGYLAKAMPAAWPQMVEQAAANKIMKQAQMKLQRRWQAEMRRERRAWNAAGATISKNFLRAI